MTKCYAKKEKKDKYKQTNKQTNKQQKNKTKQNKNMSTCISLSWADHCISTVEGIFISQKMGNQDLLSPKRYDQAKRFSLQLKSGWFEGSTKRLNRSIFLLGSFQNNAQAMISYGRISLRRLGAGSSRKKERFIAAGRRVG